MFKGVIHKDVSSDEIMNITKKPNTRQMDLDLQHVPVVDRMLPPRPSHHSHTNSPPLEKHLAASSLNISPRFARKPPPVSGQRSPGREKKLFHAQDNPSSVVNHRDDSSMGGDSHSWSPAMRRLSLPSMRHHPQHPHHHERKERPADAKEFQKVVLGNKNRRMSMPCVFQAASRTRNALETRVKTEVRDTEEDLSEMDDETRKNKGLRGTDIRAFYNLWETQHTKSKGGHSKAGVNERSPLKHDTERQGGDSRQSRPRLLSL